MFKSIKKFFINEFTVQPEEVIAPPIIEEAPPKVKKPRKPREKKVIAPAELSEKDKATANHEPYVTVTSFNIDTEDPSQGAFELDFNDVFVAKLIRAGFQGKTDYDIVDAWFTSVCRNVVLETFEQWEANFPEDSPRKRPVKG